MHTYRKDYADLGLKAEQRAKWYRTVFAEYGTNWLHNTIYRVVQK